MQDKWEGKAGWVIREQARRWGSWKKGGTSAEEWGDPQLAAMGDPEDSDSAQPGLETGPEN